MVDDNSASWGEVELVVVNLSSYADDMAELVGDDITLPVLQDTSTDDMAEHYGAERWYFTLVDKAGLPRLIHYELDTSSEMDRLLSEIAELEAE